MSTKVCSTCKNFSALTGQCRAEPPVPFLLGVDGNNKAVFAGTWPPTKPDNWCAKHQLEINHG